MTEFDTLWGSFESDETPEEEVIEKEEDLEDPEKDTDDPEKDEPEKQEDLEDPEKGADLEKDTEDPEKGKKTEDPKEELNETEKIFNSVNDLLEEEELIFVEEDAKYDATPEGLAKMMRDNMEKYKTKMEEDFAKKESEIRAFYDKASQPKFADMDTENPTQAEAMLAEYYKQTGFEDEEIQEKLQELKDLDTVSKEAKIAKRYLSKKEAKAEEIAADAARQEELDKQAQIDEYIASIKSAIDEMEEQAGFKMTNKLKKDFKSYLLDKDKDGKTKAQKANSDPNRRLKLAFLDFVDYNKKDFEIKAKTEVSNELKKKTSRFTSKNANPKGRTVEKPDLEEEVGFEKGFLEFWAPGS